MRMAYAVLYTTTNARNYYPLSVLRADCRLLCRRNVCMLLYDLGLFVHPSLLACACSCGCVCLLVRFQAHCVANATRGVCEWLARLDDCCHVRLFARHFLLRFTPRCLENGGFCSGGICFLKRLQLLFYSPYQPEHLMWVDSVT